MDQRVNQFLEATHNIAQDVSSFSESTEVRSHFIRVLLYQSFRVPGAVGVDSGPMRVSIVVKFVASMDDNLGEGLC